MGKHLWRKHSYVRIEKDDPGCMWAVFRILHYHPWHNVRRMLPYKKQKPQGGTSKGKENPKLLTLQELEEDVVEISTASDKLSSSGTGKVGKKLMKKARIGAIEVEDDEFKLLDTPQQQELQGLEDDSADLSPPTLIALLKANRKPNSSANRANEHSNLRDEPSVVHMENYSKDDQVGLLEILSVDQDLFLKILQDNPRKPRLAKSGTFPAPNPSHNSTFGRTPSKVEHKHKEVWPVMDDGRELRRAKSQRIGRSSSLKESLDRLVPVFDSSGNKEFKKHLSRSLKLTNEKELAMLGDHHGRRSFRERLASLEIEPRSLSPREMPRASLEALERLKRAKDGEARGLRLDSPREVGVLGHTEAVEAHLNEKRNGSDQIAQMATVGECEMNDEINSVSAPVECFAEDEMDSTECPLPEDACHRTSAVEYVDNIQGLGPQHLSPLEKDDMVNYNEDLQYVKYVLDVIGFTEWDLSQLEAWHLPDQPLDPALFDGIEVCCPFEPKPSSNNAKETTSMSGQQQRKVLFEMVNEALVHIQKRSQVYYPKALSSSCHVHPIVRGKSRDVDHVWKFISDCLSWKPELDQTLDHAVGIDLSDNMSGWMNLQMDSEEVALDLADWILDELLEEIICC